MLFNSTKSVWKKVGFLLFLSLFHGGCLKIGAAFLINIGWLGVHTRTRKEFLSRQSLLWLRGRTIGALRAERHTLTSAEWTSCSACHELLCSRASLFIVLRSAQHATPTNPSLFANFPRNLANAPLPPESFRTCFVCATHAHSHFCPQHWLLCHLGLY